jgi:hypothetical protein
MNYRNHAGIIQMNRCKQLLIKYKFPILLALIAGGGLLLRLYHLDTRPAWFGDEGSNLDISWNFIHGQTRFMAYEHTFVPHFPLFFFLGGIFTLLFGKTILVLRIFASLSATATIITVYFIGKELKSKAYGLMASFLFSFAYISFIYSRYAFSSTLAVLLIALLLLFCVKYLKTNERKWIYATGGVLSAIFITEIYLWPVILVLPYLTWKDKRILIKTACISLLPILIFFLYMFITRDGDLLMDIKYYFLFRNLEHGSSLKLFFDLFITWARTSYLILPGLLGIFLLKNRKARAVLVIIFLCVAIPVFSNQSSFLARNLITLSLFTALGAPAVLIGIFSICYENLIKPSFINNRLGAIIIILMMIGTFFSEISTTILFFKSPMDLMLKTKNLIHDQSSAKKAVGFVNSHSIADDLIITSDKLASLISGKVTNLFQVAAYEGIDSGIYSPKFFSKDRLFFDIPLDKAKYIINDDTEMTDWKYNSKNMAGIIEETQSWPSVFDDGDYHVRQNPLYPTSD